MTLSMTLPAVNPPLTPPGRGTKHRRPLPSREGLGVGSGAQGAIKVRGVLSSRSSAWPGQRAATRFQLLLIVACLAGLAFAGHRLWNKTGSDKVDYPYWCRDCKAVFDFSEISKDPQKWRVPRGAPSDSVVICLRCNQGWAYPAARCEQCGVVHLMHLWPDSQCPKCNPAIGQAASSNGVELTPAPLQRAR